MTEHDPSATAEALSRTGDRLAQRGPDETEPYRHVDSFDYLRIQIAVWALIDKLRGRTEPIDVLLREGHAEWLQVGDLVRPPDDIHSADAALAECFEVLDIAVALCNDGHYIEVVPGCRAASMAAQGIPDLTWWGFCEACRVSHMVVGRDTDGSYPGTVPVPVRRSRAAGLHDSGAADRG